MKVLHTFFILFALILATGLSPLAQAKDRVQYFHSDLSGSPVAATNTDGELLWEESYTPFGQRLKQSATDNTIGFTGKPEEAHLGLQYFGARWYHQASGRFISRDPASVLAHVESNPMMFNRYAYANNNPYRYVDPDGRSPVGAAGILGVIYGVYKVSSVTVDGLSIARDIYVGNYIGATITAVGMLDPSGATNKLRNINRGIKVTKGVKGGKRSGKGHTQAAKKLSRQKNRDQNNGELVCPTCGNKMVEPSQRVKGQKVHPHEANGDHIYPRAHGGDGATVKDMRNIETKCFTCNLKKSDSLP